MSDNPVRETRKERKARLQGLFFTAFFISRAPVDVAAQAAGISPKTGTRWLRSPEFHEWLVESHVASPQSVLSFARSIIIPALQRMAAIVRDSGSPATAAVAAAKLIAELMLRLHEVTQMEQRIAELERLAGGQQ